jgi:hypothetical protein
MLQTRLNEVRQLLGDHHDIPDKEIRETLWYYYFDLEKSVAWLLGTFVSQ